MTIDGRFQAPGPPGAPRQGEPTAATIENGFGIGSFVLGVASVVPCFWFLGFGFIVGFITSFLAIALGILGRQKALAGRATNGNLALGGIVLGCVGLAIAFLATAVFLISLVAGN